jgi:hypothetical protein
MKNAVPFRAPAKFAEFGIDWTRVAQTKTERTLREVFLSTKRRAARTAWSRSLLLAIVASRQGSVGEDLQAAADHAESLLGMKLQEHQHDTLDAVSRLSHARWCGFGL